MANVDNELEELKLENSLLKAKKHFEESLELKRNNDADPAAVVLVDNVPKYVSMLEKKIESLRDQVLSMTGATVEERASKIREIKKLEFSISQFNKVLTKAKKHIGIVEEHPYEEKPERPDVKPLPKPEPRKFTPKPVAPKVEPTKVELKPEPKPKPMGFKIVKKNPAATAAEIQLLVKVANDLDQKGFYEEASAVDYIIKSAIDKVFEPEGFMRDLETGERSPAAVNDLVCEDCNALLSLQVLESAAGYYLGRKCKCGPYSRESGYFKKEKDAKEALKATANGINLLSKRASKNALIKALKSREDDAVLEAIKALTNLMHNTPANSTPAKELGLSDSEFKELAKSLTPNSAFLNFERAQEIMGVSDDPTPVINTMTHNPVTGLPYLGPMPKGFCPECGKKLVMRYPGGDPENGPAGLRCPQYHQAAEPCELCPHFFHNDKCKECSCYSSWGTEEQQKEEEEMMRKLYGDDWDKNPDDFKP